MKMEVLESLETEKRQTDTVTKLLQVKTSLQQQLEEASQYQEELRSRCNNLELSQERTKTTQEGLRELLDAYKLLGVSIKSFEDNIQLQFSPAFRNELSSSDIDIVEIETSRDSWNVVRHSLPPFVPVDQLVKDSELDMKTFVSSISDYLYAYVQRQEAVRLVKKTFSKYLSDDIEVDLSVTYVKLGLLPSSPGTGQMQIVLQYDNTKTQPNSVNIKTDKLSEKLEECRRWLTDLDLHTAITNIIRNFGD